VDEPVLRQHVRGFYRAGDSTKEDADLRAAWEANNLASESTVVHTDEKIFGRTFVSVGANPDSKDRPIISAEDPRQIGVEIDTRARRITAGLRLYRDEKDRGRTRGTLYLPDSTTHIVRSRTGWVIDEEYGRDEHGLGVVPLVGFIHCRRTGNVAGRSEMSDVIKMTEDVARLFSNMMTTADALATPGRWAAGVKKEDFVDRDGKPLPTWEAYITAIKATSNSDAKFGQFEAAQLSNFFETVNNVFAWCAAVLGLPTRYAGQQTVNPAAEGAIRADESRLIGRVERMNRFDGDSWSWVMGLEDPAATNSPQVVPVAVVVRPKAEIDTSLTTLTFTVVKPITGPFPVIADQTFDVLNVGPIGSVLEFQVTRLLCTSAWLASFIPGTGVLGSGDSETVVVTVAPPEGMCVGSYTETLRVSGYSSNGYVDVQVILNIT
jgi:hypothetical protein